MQFKPVPEAPENAEGVEAILEAVPATAGAVDDCCAHLLEETRLETRSEAETWLTFLRALELAAEESAGYRRAVDPSLESVALQQAFRERVVAASTVLDALETADEPASVEAVFDAVRGEIPGYEREKLGDRFEPVWTERVRRLLEWAVVLELAERTAAADRYRYRSSSVSDETDG
ncbi:hypothetical protein GS429_09095 [Natronorubrum sp. JWXQ-INN-674]|uniref:Uncharacterized protein n=1 Tax=Natronorubrum halalkaliphilum TaxID=2691917 RepID=A0A6B0VLX7_9EURY|nr:hypothetical protein [Natronorubrum halalkaliphilum]MXV62213.1 hypothetical protein [Natronorubrum halalkaliphilum]